MATGESGGQGQGCYLGILWLLVGRADSDVLMCGECLGLRGWDVGALVLSGPVRGSGPEPEPGGARVGLGPHSLTPYRAPGLEASHAVYKRLLPVVCCARVNMQQLVSSIKAASRLPNLRPAHPWMRAVLQGSAGVRLGEPPLQQPEGSLDVHQASCSFAPHQR